MLIVKYLGEYLMTIRESFSFLVNSAIMVVITIALMPTVTFSQEGIEEIVVTARKKEETLQSIPLAVSAVTAAQIEAQQMHSIFDIAMFTPGLSNSKAFGRNTERPVIRGLSNVLAGVRFGVEAGAAYFVDGVYYPGDIGSFNVNDIERVEVIRGPQSALYARNTYSGAINFITKRPGEVTSSSVSLRSAEHGETDINFSTSQRISDNLALSLSARSYDYDGEWTNLVTGKTVGDESTDSYSLVLDYQNENFGMTFRHQTSDSDDGTRALFLQPGNMNNCYPTSTGEMNYFCGEIKTRPIALNDEAFPGTGAELNALITSWGLPEVPLQSYGSGLQWFFYPTNSTEDGLYFSGVARDMSLTLLSMDYEMESGVNVSMSMGVKDEDLATGSDSDHSPVNLVRNAYGGYAQPNGQCYPFCASGIEYMEDDTYELMIDSNQDQAFRWRIGYFNYDREQEQRGWSFIAAYHNLLEQTSTIGNSAIYGMIEYDISDVLTWSFEARSAEETKTLKEYDTNGVIVADEDGKWDSDTIRTTLTYTKDPNTLFYFTFAEGAKPGGFNGSAGTDNGVPIYAMETNENIEIGIKKVWSDGRLVTNLAVYQIDATNVQVTQPAPGTIGTLTSIVVGEGNLGEVNGVELEVNWLMNDNWNLAFNYSLADSTYKEGCDNYQWALTSGGGSYDVSNPAASTNPNGQGTCSIKGKQFAFSPKTTYSVVLSYNKQLANGSELFGGIDSSYESKKYAQVHNGAYVGAYNLFGARFGIRMESGLTLTAYGKNLGDADEPDVVTRWLDNDYSRAFFSNKRRGRSIGVELKYDF